MDFIGASMTHQGNIIAKAALLDNTQLWAVAYVFTYCP